MFTLVYVPVVVVAIVVFLAFLCGASVGASLAREDADATLNDVLADAAHDARRVGYGRALLDAHAALDKLAREHDATEFYRANRHVMDAAIGPHDGDL